MANEELRELNIQNVIREALNCFVEFGIEQTNISTIAKRANVSERSVYRYFYTKEHLVIKVAVAFWNDAFKDLHQIYRGKAYQSKTGMEQVKTILECHATQFNENYIKSLWLQELNIYIMRHDMSSEHMRDFTEEFQHLRAPLLKALQKGVNDQTIRTDYSVDYLNNVITGTFVGMLEKLAIQNKCYNLDIDSSIKEQFKIYIDMLLLFLPNQHLLK